MSSDESPELARRLGYLLKHAQLRMHELSDEALAPYGLTGRELAVLVVLAGREPSSQQQAAQRLGIDRTTMVAMLDELQAKGLVSRRPHAQDRRRNLVELTELGRETFARAQAAYDEAEREFLAPLGARAAEQLRASLHAIVTRAASEQAAG